MQNDKIQIALDKHFNSVEKIILSRQDPITGLLPASTAVTTHGDYTDAWVRDNVYSILGVWGLAQAYKKHNPDHHRTYLLSQSVVKLMRGLLNAMMRQSDRIERFKYSLKATDALHAKYGTKTGLAVVGDSEWGHLQLDASSLFLLQIAQMIASGLKLIYTMDEVNFIQNMVHYISRTYCTPDYGIWERGNKINHGTTEINCSSVGMAKAALEAMDGFNLFGNIASQEAVIHVISSDIARSRFTLHGLLPRESNSKETDAALLSIVGYPAYAIKDKALLKRTRDKIIKKLAGNYGCKRFLLDGHQSAIEDESRLHYEPSELRAFEHIESEWPLFFTYLLLDAIMRGDAAETKHYREKLEPLFVEQDGLKLLPELYTVPQELIEAEKLNPSSQVRIPNENLPLVWAQSLFMLSEMILDKILRPNDIDPLRRRERVGYKRTTNPLVCVLAQNDSVKQQLLNLGINSETLEEVKPIKIMHASELSKVHTILGKNEKLSLSGRPLLVTRTITSSRLYLLNGEEVLFLPYYFNPKGFYFSYDNKLLIEHYRASLKFLAQHWNHLAQPILPFLVRENMLLEKEKNEVVELLHAFQTGECASVTIKHGTLGQLLTTTAVERIDYLHGLEINEILQNAPIKKTSLSDSKNAQTDYALTGEELQKFNFEDDNSLSDTLLQNHSRLIKATALKILWQRHGADFTLLFEDKEVKLSTIAEENYELAAICHDWAVVRRIASITGKYDDRLEDTLLDIVVRQKRLAVGRAYSEKATFSKPLDSVAILKTLREFCGTNTAEDTLTQEIMLHLSHLIRTEPALFENMITLRTWYFVQLLVGQISRSHNLAIGDAYESLLAMAPNEIYNCLRNILRSFNKEVTELGDQENLHASEVPSFAPVLNGSADDDASKDWARWRKDTGMIGRMSSNFYKDVWHLLQQCNGLVIGDKYSVQSRIGSELTLGATAGEQNFALRIDTLLHSIDAPDYRQLNTEVIESLAKLFRQTPQLQVKDDLVLDILIGHAVRIAWVKENPNENYDDKRGLAWESIYKTSPIKTNLAFIEAFMYLIAPESSMKAEY